MSPVTPFALATPPPPGLTVLEASAGTGKTYSLAGLTVLGLAMGRVTTREVLVVTFTEAATAELSGRLRSRLAKAITMLERPAGSEPVTDDVDRLLVDGTDDDRATRAGRLRAALAEFDAMTISTIHGFCQRLLSAAGATAVAVSADDSDIDDVVGDHILASGLLLAKPERVTTAVKRRLGLPDAVMADHAGAKPEQRTLIDAVVDLVERSVATVLHRRRRWRHRTFDSMLTDTRDLIADPGRGGVLIAELRDRFRLVLIDEFQDTDRVQWDIFRTAFLDTSQPGERAAVVVVGDPKQSIYRFRGAELSAYLAAVDYARETGGALHSLGTNYRSDARLLSALETIFDGATFGDDSVRFVPVAAGRSGDEHLVDPSDQAAPLQWRIMHPPVNDKGAASSPDGQRWAKADLVNEVIRHLTEVQLVDDTSGTSRMVQPADIGIIVRSNSLAEEIAEMLRAAGVPTTTSGSDSVLGSVAAQHWDTLIAALSKPNSLADARAVALGAFGSLTAQDIADLTEADEAALLDRQRELIVALSRGGVPRLMAELRRNGYPQRLLSHLGGERLLTDLDHIAELLQRGTEGRPCSPARLAAVMVELRSLSGDTVSGDLLDRRLDRDDDTVKIMTIHKAKGLEFPIVFCPVLWNAPRGGSELRHAHIDPPGQRFLNTAWVLDLGSAKAVSDIKNAAVIEEQGEHRRNLYVAMTRAVHRLVMWDVPAFTTKTPLSELLGATCGTDHDAVAAASGGAISVVNVIGEPSPTSMESHRSNSGPLEVAQFDRDLRSAWKVWSFSGIERAVGDDSAHQPIESIPAPVGGFDEPSAPVAEPAVPVGHLRSVPGSAAFGSLVHGVLELVDFASTDLDADLVATCRDALRYQSMGVDADVLAAGLGDALRSPLGGPLGATRLIDIRRSDRLDELEFLLPLSSMSALDLAATVRDGLDPDDPMRPWFEVAADGGLDVDVEGMLTGSIDLVARVNGQYLVADYKTNRLSTDAQFTTDEMVAEMHRHGYPLQAVLYLVALRRYLRLRQPDAPVDEVVLGAAYLFVRGMDPARDHDDTRGVVWWCPPSAVIARLDTLIETGVGR